MGEKTKTQRVFLTAEWRKLVMANFLVDPSILQKYLPYKTELDYYNSNHYVSIVGFMFLNTKVLGLSLPYHKNFDEINLRFYVRYKENGIWKRGVTFIKEIVSKKIVTFVANNLYNENYVTLPVKHELDLNESDFRVKYEFDYNGEKNFISASADNEKFALTENSEAEFITEHYWGYTKLKDNKTLEYQVEHLRWELYKIKDFEIKINFAKVYGEEFSEFLSAKPYSRILAEGSKIVVRKGRII